MAQHTDQRIDFFSRLAATERSTEIPESADVYGWLCGSWDLHVLHYRGSTLPSAASPEKFTRRACSRGAPSRTCGSCRNRAIALPMRIGR